VIRNGDARASLTSSTENATSRVPTRLGSRGKSDNQGPDGRSNADQIAKPTTMPHIPISTALAGENNDRPIARHADQLHRLATASSSSKGRKDMAMVAVCMGNPKDHN
jgi:hypothetical protein